MTKFQKQMLTIAAAGALTAVTALPAMAFENEFHGIFNFNSVFSNYNSAGGGDKSPTALRNNAQMNNFFEQRARIQYIAKASDDLKLFTHFEVNTRFGNSAMGGDLDTDGLGSNIWVKHIYLDFNWNKNLNTKLGLMPYKDTLKGIFIDADAPVILTTAKMGGYTLNLAYSRFADDSQNGGANGSLTPTRIGDANKDLFIMDNIFAFSKDTKAAFSYYFVADYASSGTGYTGGSMNAILNTHTQKQNILLHTLGLSGETKLGKLALSGFFAMQAGVQKPDIDAKAYPTRTTLNLHGWAANAAASMDLGAGKLRTAFLFTSGNNTSTGPTNNHYKGWVGTSVDSYNESGMMIVARNTYNSPTSQDQYIRRDITNIALLTMGYDAKIGEKTNINTNVGFAWAPSSNGAPVDQKTGKSNGSDFMGAEINLETGYQLYKNLKVMAQAGYMFLGGYYKGAAANSTAASVKDPENPYKMTLQARYSF